MRRAAPRKRPAWVSQVSTDFFYALAAARLLSPLLIPIYIHVTISSPIAAGAAAAGAAAAPPPAPSAADLEDLEDERADGAAEAQQQETNDGGVPPPPPPAPSSGSGSGTADDQVAAALRRIASHIGSAKKFAKASQLLRELLSQVGGTVGGGWACSLLQGNCPHATLCCERQGPAFLRCNPHSQLLFFNNSARCPTCSKHACSCIRSQ